MGVSAVGMGTLHNLVYRDERGDHVLKPRGLWLAWQPEAKALLLCTRPRRARRGLAGIPSSSVRRIHRQFHGTQVRSSRVVTFPDPVHPVRAFGLLRELTYKVPKGIVSPQKNPYLWRHQFGDHGERGHGTDRGEKAYSPRFMPYLARDSRGSLFIVRRPGNKYYVDEWLMW